MNNIQVNVLEEDILEGKVMDALLCPLARAISRATRTEASVAGGTVALTREQRASGFRHRLPTVMVNWYQSYDSGEVVKATSFTLDLDTVVKTISHRDRTWHEAKEELVRLFSTYKVEANKEAELVIITNKNNNNRQVLGKLESDIVGVKLVLPTNWKERLKGKE